MGKNKRRKKKNAYPYGAVLSIKHHVNNVSLIMILCAYNMYICSLKIEIEYLIAAGQRAKNSLRANCKTLTKNIT